MEIIKKFELFKTQIKESNYTIYVDYIPTEWKLENRQTSQTVFLNSKGANAEDTRMSLVDFLNMECLKLGIRFQPHFFNVPVEFLRENDLDDTSFTNYYHSVEYIPELRAVNIVTNHLYKGYVEEFGPIEYISACKGHMLLHEIELINTYNYTSLSTSKGYAGFLKKQITGSIFMPKTVGQSSLICPLPLSKGILESKKLQCLMDIENGLPYSGNSDNPESRCNVYHIRQLINNLGIGEIEGINNQMKNNTSFCIQLIYYIICKEFNDINFGLILTKDGPVGTFWYVDSYRNIQEALSAQSVKIEPYSFSEYLYRNSKLGEITLNEFNSFVEGMRC